MNRPSIHGAVLALLLCLSAATPASEYYPAVLVLRYFVEGSEAAREDLAPAQRDYYLERGREAASFRILDDQGKVAGRGSWMAFASEDAARSFLSNDPYSRAGLYRETSVDKADIYLLDKWFAIAPADRSGDRLQAVYDRYDDEVSSAPVPER
jgi:uncharacterized protein YciI